MNRRWVLTQIEQYFQNIESNYKSPVWRGWTRINNLDGYLQCASDADLLTQAEKNGFLERLDRVRCWLEENE
jgi:hypothetical protein